MYAQHLIRSFAPIALFYKDKIDARIYVAMSLALYQKDH